MQAIFNAFFFALFLMLIFSSGVILYGSLFRGGEVAYLLTMPIHEERIFQHEFQHAVVLSSWGFVLLGSPMLVAYGIVAHAPWYYYAMVLPMLVAFVFIPAGIGAILLLAIMHFFPRKRVHLLALAVGLLVGGRGLVLLVALLAAGNRSAHSPLVPGNAPPPATRPGEAAAQLVAQFGPAGSGRQRLVGGRAVSRPLDRQRPVLPRVGRDVRRADLPQGLLGGRRPRLAAGPACRWAGSTAR